MDYIVDYFSFSIPTPRLMAQWDLSATNEIPFHCDERTGGIAWLLASQNNWSEITKQGIFDRGLRFPDVGISYFDGHKSDVTLIQVSGTGCAYFREIGHLETLINDWHDRCTRIDVACDIQADVEPEIFARQRSNRRFDISQHIKRESGVTWYVGSRESDRFARVYKYNPPHPRADKLRVEVQLSKKQAKHAAALVASEGIQSVGEQLSRTFAWSHPSFLHASTTQGMASAPRSETKGNTVFWLYKQVLPALRKSAEKGDIETLIAFESQVHAIIEEYKISREED